MEIEAIVDGDSAYLRSRYEVSDDEIDALVAEMAGDPPQDVEVLDLEGWDEFRHGR